MQQLLLDGNYLLHKNVRTLHKLNTLYGDLYNALTKNVEKYKHLHKFNKIFIVSDSKKKSWRLQESDIYKGTREQDMEIDWKFVYKTYDQWKSDMTEHYNVVQRNHIEGDDWIAVLVRKGNAMGYSNVIIASDRDMQQLVSYRLKGEKSYINIQINDYNGKEKVFVPEGWQIFLNEYDNNRSNDIFNLDDGHSWVSFLNRIIRNFQKVEINHTEKLFCKLVQGDKGDNVNSIHVRPQKTNTVPFEVGDDVLYGDAIVNIVAIKDNEADIESKLISATVPLTELHRYRRIGDKGAVKIWNFYKENFKPHFNTDEETFGDDVLLSYQRSHKITLTDEQIADAKVKLIQNAKLMELHYKHYPEWVMEEIADELADKI